jgi:Tol biopolymer transport system component
MYKRFIYIFFSFLVFAGCRKDSVPPPVAPEIDNRLIVFVSNRETSEYKFQVFTMNIDGSNVRRLTHDSNNYIFPQFSPDGSKILFYSLNGVNDEIYIMDTNGDDFTNLTLTPGNDRLPQFSPDGSKIVFTSDRDGNREIYIMDIDGTNQTRLTNTNITDHSPQFSPDGKKIVFYSTFNPMTSSETYNVYIVDIDGSNLTKLTPNSTYFHNSSITTEKFASPSVFDAAPRYSPDGSKIVFMTYYENYFVINMMDSAGGNQTELVYGQGDNFAPIFFPDGSQILFRSHRTGDFDLFRMAPYEGAAQVRITIDNGHTYFADFSEDGSQILYFSDIDEVRYEYYHIYISNADGSNRKKLTQGPYADYFGNFQHKK